MNLVATAAFGVEAMVTNELKSLGYSDMKTENGRITFSGDFKDIAITNTWLRCADRVLVEIGKFKAYSFEELFERTKALPWEDWIPIDGCFPVDGKSTKSKLFSISDCQSIVKKAIVTRLNEKYGITHFEETGALYRVEVAMYNDYATLTIDTTGPGLNKRGYRAAAGIAPLKETLTSSILNLSYWKKDKVLIDPMCGSGTIPIEAALMARNIAPGLTRDFSAKKWGVIDSKIWKNVKEHAYSVIDYDKEVKIVGSDINPKAIRLSKFHAEEAGVDDCIIFTRTSVSEIIENKEIFNVTDGEEYGCIITNPPYGKRLNDMKEVEDLYKVMGKVFERYPTYSKYILSAHKDFEKFYGKQANKKRKLFSGNIKCNLYQYFGPPPKRNRE